MTQHLIAAVVATVVGVAFVGCDRDDSSTSTNNGNATGRTASDQGSRTRSAEDTPANAAAQAQQAARTSEPDVTKTNNVSSQASTAGESTAATTPSTAPANR